jgi:glutamine synthetase
MDSQDTLKLIKDSGIKFVAFQFTDFFGKLYALWVSAAEVETGIHEGIGMSGWPHFTPVEKSDVLLRPDCNSFKVLPWSTEGGKVAAVMCDMYFPDGEEVGEAPRTVLKRAVLKARQTLGEHIDIYAAPECEFFLLKRDEKGELVLHDTGSYFSAEPADRGFELRNEISNALNDMGMQVGKHHHEAPRTKHELVIQHDRALNIADKIQFVKLVIRKLAHTQGLIATFMPKPFEWEYGAGWHTHLSLVDRDKGNNIFYDPNGKYGFSDTGLYFMAGLLRHARALVSITNPTVNSYKRLVPGSQAPIYVAWSKFNRSALVRIPPAAPMGTRFEYRCSDGACNTYLSLASLICAARKELPPEPVDQNIYELTDGERQRLGIDTVPGSLHEALEALEQDEVVQNALGPLYPRYLKAKKDEWHEYSYCVHEWEREKYLDDSGTIPYLKYK